MEELAYELNVAGAKLARKAADDITARDPSRPRFVAGVLGPTNRTASISPDVNDPATAMSPLTSSSRHILERSAA